MKTRTLTRLAVAYGLALLVADRSSAAQSGSVFGWGEVAMPVVQPGTRFSAIAAGEYQSLALKSDGTVVAWGENDHGQSTVPAGLTGVIAVAAGYEHDLALKSDGTVVAWGANYSGESTVPSGLTGVIAIAAGEERNLVLKSDGTVVAWGANYLGESTVPSGLTGVIAIAAGGYHSLALKSYGTVVAWGGNGHGESTVPSGLTGVIAIAAGGYHSLALKSDGTVVAWGAGRAGWNGGVNLGQSTVPSDLSDVVAIAAGGYQGVNFGQSTVPSDLSDVVAIAAGRYHSLALKSDGTVVAWGATFSSQSTVPTGLTGVIAISAGYLHNLVLKSDGTVVAWGGNSLEQSAVPTGLSGVIAIAAGGSHDLALKSDGTVVAWGANHYYGQNSVPTGLTGVIAISAGYLHNLVLKSDGTVVAWGSGAPGYSGVDNLGQSAVPNGLSGVMAVAAGGYHSLALKSDGTVVAWGAGRAGWNGGDNLGQSTVPSDLSDVVAIAAGLFHSLALKSDGTVVAWGAGGPGQSGENQRGQSTVPSGLSGVIAIDAGYLHSLALKSDGTVVAWGAGEPGQTGYPHYGQSKVPTGLSSVVGIAAGGSDSLALVSASVLPVAISHVQASQRPGTTLVDLFYEFSGMGSGYAISVTVSSDGGASFTVPATHFSGDGVTSTAAPGTGRHILWDAGADFPGQFSIKMRLKVAVGSAFAVSPIFTLDTRAVPTGSLTGLVQGGGKPIANAQARIDGTSFAASTGADGRFTLANVPAASGYLLKVSAAGFASKPQAGITVTSGTKDLGTIQLATLGGPYRFLPLQPDVNPTMTQIEDGGVGYRYYMVVTADGKTAAGGVAVSVRVAGGSTISQAGDISGSWAGREAGVSDDDGIVRLRIPASALNAGVQTLEVVESGTVKAQFQAWVVARHLDQVWQHSLGGGISGKLVGIQLEGDVDFESEVRHEIEGQSIGREVITRSRSATLKAGVEAGAGVKFGAGVSASVGAGGYVRGDLSSTYEFDSSSTDPGENAMKLYVALADPINSASSINPMTGFFVDYVKDTYETRYLDSSLFSSSGGVRLGGYANAGAGIGLKLDREVSVGAHAELSGEREGFFDYEKIFRGDEPQSIFTLGMATRGDASVQLGASFGKKKDGKSDYGFDLFNVGGEAEFAGRIIKSQADTRPLRVEIRQKLGLQAGVPIGLTEWSLYEGLPVQAACRREYTELMGFSLPSEGAFSRLNLLAPAWNAIAGGGQGSVITPGQPAALAGAVLQSAMNDGVTLDYKKTVLAMEEKHLGFDAEIDPFVAGLGFSLEGTVGRGVEVVNERGCVWKYKRMGLETYPAISLGDLPVKSILQLERQWAGGALAPITEAFNRVVNTVAQVGQTVIHAGASVLTFSQGVIAGGTSVISSWTRSSAGHNQMVRYIRKANNNGSLDYLPAGASNYVYGIGGIYRFESTNSFNGTGTLTIAFSPAEVTGLNPADLRIYYLPDGTNRWQFVGGTVNVASNTVTATISKLGTYTLAPPMPTGDLQLTLSTNTMAADGVSQMTVVVTNLALNTGNVATEQWMFTATAVGVSILNPDLDATTSGVQVMSTNGAVTLLLRAPISGTVGRVNLASVVGDAFGSTSINLLDNAPPATPAGVDVTAGQSRIWVSWRTNSEPDLAGYRVYYRMGVSGPPWDGAAAVEGTPSPVMVTGTNCLLRGLALGANYFVAVSAVDTTGNESPLSAPSQVTTTPMPPAPPTAVVARFGADGTNILMWALSEDDGYNDRDVVRYDVLRAVLPGGTYAKVAEVGAGIGLYSETNPTVGATQYVGYAVVAVANSGASSVQTLGNRLMASNTGFDNDGDGIFDSWMMQYFGHPTGQASDQSLAQDDPDRDGLTNLQEYLWGTNPGVADRPHLVSSVSMPNGAFVLSIEGVYGRSVALQTSHDLSSWVTVTNFNGTNVAIPFEDRTAANSTQRFYRAIIP